MPRPVRTYKAKKIIGDPETWAVNFFGESKDVPGPGRYTYHRDPVTDAQEFRLVGEVKP